MNKNILFLAYYYLPVNNAGVQRIEKFVKYLPEFGWQCFVLSAGRKQKEDPAHIFRALNLLKTDETESFTDYSAKQTIKVKIKKWIRDYCLVPDSKIFWFLPALVKALRVIRQKKIEYIFSSFPPGTSILLGLFLKWLTGKFWIADFRDGWVFDPLDPILKKKSFKQDFCRLLEYLTVRNADVVLTTSPDVKEYFIQHYNLSLNKCFLITNGYDEEDFKKAQAGLEEFRKNIFSSTGVIRQEGRKPLIISHTGAFHFSHPGNTPRYFLEALKIFLEKYPSARQDIRVILAGNLSQTEKELAKKLGIDGIVLVKGLLSHLDSVRLRLISDYLLLVDRPLASKNKRSSYIHGKLFEHLRAQKPILAFVPNGVVRDFLIKNRIGQVIEPDDVKKISNELSTIYNKWQNGKTDYQFLKLNKVQKFERKNLAEKLNQIINKL